MTKAGGLLPHMPDAVAEAEAMVNLATAPDVPQKIIGSIREETSPSVVSFPKILEDEDAKGGANNAGNEKDNSLNGLIADVGESKPERKDISSPIRELISNGAIGTGDRSAGKDTLQDLSLADAQNLLPGAISSPKDLSELGTPGTKDLSLSQSLTSTGTDELRRWVLPPSEPMKQVEGMTPRTDASPMAGGVTPKDASSKSLEGFPVINENTIQDDRDEMKASSMYRMVADVSDFEGGQHKLVFMTNRQARICGSDDAHIERFINALDMPKPKLVIQLLPSLGLKYLELLSECPTRPGFDSMKLNPPSYPWVSKVDGLDARAQLVKFMSEVLIPLAEQTRALIVCSAGPECELTNTLNRAVELRKSKWGTRMPFTILATECNLSALYNMEEKNIRQSLWFSYMKETPEWILRHKQICICQKRGSASKTTYDLNKNATVYFLCDGINDEKHGKLGFTAAHDAMVNRIIAFFKTKVPCLALKSGIGKAEKPGLGEPSGLSAIVRTLACGIPTVLLDTRQRVPFEVKGKRLSVGSQEQHVAQVVAEHERLSKQLQTADIMDAATLSYFHKAFFPPNDDDDDQVSNAWNPVPLYSAIEKSSKTSRSHVIVDISQKRPEAAVLATGKTSVLAGDAALEVGCSTGLTVGSLIVIDKGTNVEETHMIREITGGIELLDTIKLSEAFKFDHERGFTVEKINRDKIDGKTLLEKTLVNLAKHHFQNCWERLSEAQRKKSSNSQEHYSEYYDNWLAQIQVMFKSKQMRALNVHNLDRAEKLLWKLVKLDELPKSNCLEGLLTLRSAWDQVDICAYHARWYKIISKIGFAFQLLIQVLIVFTTTMQYSNASAQNASTLRLRRLQDCSECMAQCQAPTWHEDLATPGHRGLEGSEPNFDYENEESFYPNVLFCLALCNFIILSLMAVWSPATRWRHLRFAACNLESAMWKYRSRVGEFQITTHDPTGPEDNLSKFLRNWLDSVLGGLDLQGTAFSRVYGGSVYKHCQYDGNLPKTSTKEEEEGVGSDDFHTPVKPKLYILLRVCKVKQFYSQRIPIYMRRRKFWIILCILCSGASSACTFWGAHRLVAFVGSLATAGAAWMEFADLGRKIERYNTTVKNLEKLLIWWYSLRDVEQASKEKGAQLVFSAENIITGEFQAWQSAAPKEKDKDGKKKGLQRGDTNNTQESDIA
eukprot:gnl/MRDRNA2_/MRDRNA2_28993_c0_seq1.p1 gnl/MRDRNA2_/MRDRNA2_28993_c0~~gnl/MRDRNA2_/MRDRNA2_28993_c0_seq1.p1  ORF type:complete len:1179 (+),score=188.07 gnl/MRDRNA2_/MRDRNA2_28993_c0_seq1:101-3637(+)